MTLAATGSTVAADGQTPRLLTATLRDMGGRPLTGQQITFKGMNSNLILSPASLPSNCQGQATIHVASSAAGNQTVTGYFRGIPLARTALKFNCPGVLLASSSWSYVGTGNAAEINNVVADLNNDGLADVVLANGDGNNIAVLLSTGQGRFAAPVGYVTSTFPAHVAAADFNRDGNVDVVVASFPAAQVAIYTNNGAGGLTLRSTYATSSGVRSIVTADFNQDGNADVVASAHSASNSNLNLFYGNGDGTLKPSINVPVGNNPVQLAAGDLNGDGLIDLAVACNVANQVQIVLNTASGFVAPRTVGSPSQPNYVAIGDLNQDGYLDIVAGNANAFQTILGTGFGAFASPNTYTVAAGLGAYQLVDLNRDGRADLVASGQTGLYTYLSNNAGQPSTASIVVMPYNSTVAPLLGDLDGDGIVDVSLHMTSRAIGTLLNDGTGTLTPTANCPVPGVSSSLILADFNQDGNLDVVTTSGGANSISFNSGLGNGYFTGYTQTNVGFAPTALVAADFNRDGNLDVAVASSAGAKVIVLQGNGRGSFGNANTLSTGLAPKRLIAVDFDNDGNMDLATANASSNTLSVFRNLGGGSFSAATTVATGPSPFSLVSGYFNADLNVDLAVLNVDSTVGIFLGDGNMGLSPMVTYVTPSSLGGLNAADFDRNGTTDLVCSAGTSTYFFYGVGDGTFPAYVAGPAGLVSSGADILVADLNGDSYPDLFRSSDTLMTVLLGTSTGPVSVTGNYSIRFRYNVVCTFGDLNNDGRPDIICSSNTTPTLSVTLNSGCF